eukprot:5581895-Amphidinium_carterae.1
MHESVNITDTPIGSASKASVQRQTRAKDEASKPCKKAFKAFKGLTSTIAFEGSHQHTDTSDLFKQTRAKIASDTRHDKLKTEPITAQASPMERHTWLKLRTRHYHMTTKVTAKLTQASP